jgi:predicted amidohydrolase
MKIGLAQLNSQNDEAANLAQAQKAVASLAAAGCDLVMLPEMFNHRWTDEANREAAQPIPGPVSTWASAQARKLGINLHAGSIIERRETAQGLARFNTSVVFDRQGHEVARYSKIHLFDIDLPDGICYRESTVVSPGKKVVVVEMEGVRIGLTICYDLRFPELYRALALQRADLSMVPAAFTVPTGISHWEPLLRARAIENGVYVAACGQWGPSAPGKAPCYGHSMVVDPWGMVTAQCTEGVSMVTAEIDLAHLADVRSRMPVLRHRRPDLFS